MKIALFWVKTINFALLIAQAYTNLAISTILLNTTPPVFLCTP